MSRAPAIDGGGFAVHVGGELRRDHQKRSTRSLEVGELADLIVLDRNVLTIPAEEIAEVKVLQTVVGGRVVYEVREIRRSLRFPAARTRSVSGGAARRC